MNTISLNMLPLGSKAKVKNLKCNGSLKRRFLDLGLVGDTVVEALHKSPCGDPIAYFIRGAVIALRSEEAENIEIEPCNLY